MAKKKLKFHVRQVPMDVAMRIFAYSPFKLSVLNRMPENAKVNVVRCGDFIDLCESSVMPSSRTARDIRVLSSSTSQWTAGTPNSLSRLHCISFASKQSAMNWTDQQLEIQKRDHRVIGKTQKLFHFSSMSPGSPFMLPHGMRIRQKLTDLLRHEYRKDGFEEVMTPLVLDKALWETSGHWQNYKTDMFAVTDMIPLDKTAESDAKGLKPMNCPGHCLLYGTEVRSFRDLPLRFAEFSALHRNEATGSLTGLTRVRQFHQDDGHIFCMPSQVQQEIEKTLQMIDRIYKTFGFSSYELSLSTRPETGFICNKDRWDEAEAALTEALNSTKTQWQLKPGDGAFYGPKIDIHVNDAMSRRHQTATIQLDFQLPERFDLQYISAANVGERPVVIHRAVFGSFERMMAILTEHYAGKWPFWMSPRQAVVIPVHPSCNIYASQVHEAIKRRFHVDVDLSSNTLDKKMAISRNMQYNYVLVVGETEAREMTVSVTQRGKGKMGKMDIATILSMFNEEAKAEFIEP